MSRSALACYATYGRDVLWRHRIAGRLRSLGASAYVDARLPWTRYYFLVLKFLTACETELSVKVGSRRIIGPQTYRHHMDAYARLAFGLPGVRFTNRTPTRIEGRTLMTGDGSRLADADGWARHIHLRYDIHAPRPAAGDWVVAPFPMHPLRYRDGDDERLAPWRASRRPIRILFAGNVDRDAYNTPSMRALRSAFGYLSRGELFEGMLDGHPVDFVASRSGLADALSARGRRRLVVATADRYSIPQASWMEVLSQADFFVALPGVLMPMCHNVVEALAVGTIPILMHPEWFHPRLTHGVNCLTFAGVDGLRSRISEAFEMSGDEIDRLREAAVAYYDRHLSPRAFGERIRQWPTRDLTVFFNCSSASEPGRVTRDSVAIAAE